MNAAPATPHAGPRYCGPLAVAAYFAALKLLVHLAVNGYLAPHFGYGFFDDEFYYLDCGRRLAWGYVDQPPLVAVAAKVGLLMGGSMFAVRLLPALAGALLVMLTGMVARELGARTLGVAIACGCVVATPGYLFEASFLSMNAFEPVLWLALAYLVLRMINGADPRWWLAVGAVTGIALLNKHTVIAFLFGLLVGLLLRPERALLRSRWFVLAVLIATAIALPNFLWQWHHGWPMLVYLKAQRTHADVTIDPAVFFLAHYLQLGAVTAGYWIAGLGWLFWGPSAKRYRAFGWAYLFTAAVFVLSKGKSYYLLPAGALLYAAGGSAHDLIARQKGRTWWALPAALCLLGFVLSAPFALPAFPLRYEEGLMRYWSARIPMPGSGPTPRIFPHFGSMVGWPEMAQAVAHAYQSLPPEQQARTAVLATSYQRAGALDYYRSRYGLPQVIGTHQTYFLWGTQGFRGDSLLVVGPPPAALLEGCADVRPVGMVDNADARPEMNGPILLCSGLKRPLDQIWPSLRHWE